MKFSFLKSIKNYIKSIVWALIILFSGAFPVNKLGRIGLFGIRHIDKLFHFLMYFIFSLILYFELRKNLNTLKSRYFIYIFIFTIPLVWGIIMELIQYFLIASREGSIADILANICGMLAGILFILIAGKYLVQN